MAHVEVLRAEVVWAARLGIVVVVMGFGMFGPISTLFRRVGGTLGTLTDETNSGSTPLFCADPKCQPDFGKCDGGSQPAAASQPGVASRSISADGSCGGDAGNTCAGSTFGDCCSGYGFWYVYLTLSDFWSTKLLCSTLALFFRALQCWIGGKRTCG